MLSLKEFESSTEANTAGERKLMRSFRLSTGSAFSSRPLIAVIASTKFSKVASQHFKALGAPASDGSAVRSLGFSKRSISRSADIRNFNKLFI